MSLPPVPPSLRPLLDTSSKALHAVSGASGPFWIPPVGVIRPRTADDVAAAVSWAATEGVPLIPRGAGTGMPAGNVGPWVVLDLSGLRGELSVDPDRRIVTGAPGVVASEAAQVAASTGLELPALPSSARWCTLGGMVATNASGARSLRWGSARRWLRGARWVEGDGTVRSATREHGLEDGPGTDEVARRWSHIHSLLSDRFPDRLPWPEVAKNSSGYALDAFLPSGDPLDLLAGSEGTLAVLTEVSLELVRPDDTRHVMVAGLPNLAALVQGARLARRLGANACEYFGRALVDLGGLGDDARLSTLSSNAGLLLVEFGGEPTIVEASTEIFHRWARETGGVIEAESASAQAALWGMRHQASPRIMQQVGRGRRSVQIVEDCVVPVARLDEFVDRLERILAAARLPSVIFGHAGQGNLHVNPLVDPGLPGWRDTIRLVLEDVTGLVADLGGTLSGEHGDGRLRAHGLARTYRPAVIEAFRDVKRSLDPEGILNPGVILPLKGRDPLEGLGEAPEFSLRSQGPESLHR